MKPKKNVKNNILPHSQAKLDLYKTYLDKYFTVLGLAQGITRINLYDIFCGTGIYEDGNIGSPIIAFNSIKANRDFFLKNNWPRKPITLTVNDGNKESIEKVRTYLEEQNNTICNIEYHNLEAGDMFKFVQNQLATKSSQERNLVFIDPYGYKNIRKESLYNILQNNTTEIILFLPTSQMYRFSNYALEDMDKPYEPLRNFIFEFFEESHPMRNDQVDSIFSYIQYLKKAFSFNDKFYTSSHYLQRDNSNYFAIFYITSNIYGLDRMLSAKWQQDPVKGQGTRLRTGQTFLFDDQFKQEDKNLTLEWLEEIMINYLRSKERVTNIDLYEFVLKNDFRATFAVNILKEWTKASFVTVFDYASDEKYKPNAYYLNYDNYKSLIPKVYFKLK